MKDNQSDWDEHIPLALLVYRTAIHESTGHTPTMLMMGHEIRIPIDLMSGTPEDDDKEHTHTDYAQKPAEGLERAQNVARDSE